MNKWLKIRFGILLFISTSAYAQLPSNIGFEKGTFEGWECSIGKRNLQFQTMDPPAGPVFDRHTLIDTNSRNILDEYGHFPVLCPNGSNYSIKLGVATLPQGKVQRVSYTFKVPVNVTSYSIVFNYAVVLENPSHSLDQQPLFTARVYDVTDDTPVDCPAFEFAASGSLVNDVGFNVSDKFRSPGSSVYYKDWSTAMIDLASYAGKDVRIEFTAEDCGPGGHFGYAYLDIDEVLSVKPITGNIFCSNQTETALIGPTGFAEYKWYKDGDLTRPPLIGQSVVVPAVDGQKYVLGVTPFPTLGCPDFLDVILQKLPEAFNLVVADKVYGCTEYGADLTASGITTGSSSNMKFAYYKDASGLIYLPNPKTVTTKGTYYIRGTNEGGCTDIKPVQVLIGPPEINAADHQTIQFPAVLELANTFTHQPGYSYTYFKDADAKEAISSKVNTTGTYYIKVITRNQCSLIAPIYVTVTPPPPYTITAPSAFTPNGDGINDKFSVTIDGIASFKTLDIFNRYGQKVFSAKSQSNYWDGNIGSQQLPAGTYYWIFEGVDEYYHTKIKKASSITIIR